MVEQELYSQYMRLKIESEFHRENDIHGFFIGKDLRRVKEKIILSWVYLKLVDHFGAVRTYQKVFDVDTLRDSRDKITLREMVGEVLEIK
ncbi:hypothetical protein HOE04_04745 [archaeon]|nr:hypothetical protein [archaeon]